jgi:hypothetical protein
MSRITEDQKKAIADYIADKHICKGLGTKEEACSMAYINLAFWKKADPIGLLAELIK